ncbi:Retrovirus-related Pol polyprotein from transposon 17.6, partial [Stegodyphus mimosarum]
MVRIKTIEDSSIPYMSAVNLKFKIQNKWFTNLFYVTQNNWNSTYQMILGYDFIQCNRILLDTVNKKLIIDNTHLNFEENSPNKTVMNSFINAKKKNHNLNVVRMVSNITVLPGQSQIISLAIPEALKQFKEILLCPKTSKIRFHINESLHTVGRYNHIQTIIENNTNDKLILRKNSVIGTAVPFHFEDIVNPKNHETLQINTLNLQEVIKLRKEELHASDFKLDHLNEKAKSEMIELLMNNYAVFSKSYNTLGSTDKVVPEFKLLHNFPIQTRPYPIPKIAKQYAQQEIAKLLEAGIIEPSSSSYSFPVIFVRKKSLPGEDKNTPKFRMVVDYRLLNSITESYKICLPKISEILHNIAGRNLYCVLDLKSAFFQIKLQDSDKEKLAFCTE